MRFDGRNATLIFVLLYVAMYGAFGVASPFWPRFFEWRGLSALEIGLLLGAGRMVRLLSGPVLGRVADVTGNVSGTLAACLLVAAATAVALLGADAFWWLLLIHLLQAAALAPVTSNADALAIHGSAQRPPYGIVRGAASAAFIAGTLVVGQLIGWMGLAAMVWLHTALLLMAAAAAFGTPRSDAIVRDVDRTATTFGDLRALWSLGSFRALIVVSTLVYGSHAVHDAFSVIQWQQAGMSPGAAGLLWSEAVAAEVVVFMLLGGRLVDWLGVHGAATLAAAAGVVRWCVAAATTETMALALVQPLHGLTFALLHLACMRLIGELVPARLAATAQALYALGNGLLSAVLTLFAGGLYADYGGGAFVPMAVLCALALPFAWFGVRLAGPEGPPPASVHK